MAGGAGGAVRELCVHVVSVGGLPKTSSSSGAAMPSPYVHYRLLDFPEHFTPAKRASPQPPGS